MTTNNPLHLFDGFGVELEYMIVGKDTLDVLPVSDKLLHHVSGAYNDEVDMGALSWSNELALHVIELKTNGPADALAPLPDLFQNDIRHINDILGSFDGRLMPGGMHPWMDPMRETRLWPHEYNAVYEAYNRIFDCRGHGWSNLQSVHLNLPFNGDDEFAALHTAIRLMLPLLPALAASTPVMDGCITGIFDNRLDVYRFNQKRIPQIAGNIIPEPAYSKTDYEQTILLPMFAAIAPYDHDDILQHEWLNSRGAIARFMRNTIEIRLLDIQECPLADLAVLFLVSQIVRALTDQTLASYEKQRKFDVRSLADILATCITSAENAMIDDQAYLGLFNYPSPTPCRAGDLLSHLAQRFIPASSAWKKPIDLILTKGTLASRILHQINGDSRREKLREVYTELCRCLAAGVQFE